MGHDLSIQQLGLLKESICLSLGISGFSSGDSRDFPKNSLLQPVAAQDRIEDLGPGYRSDVQSQCSRNVGIDQEIQIAQFRDDPEKVGQGGLYQFEGDDLSSCIQAEALVHGLELLIAGFGARGADSYRRRWIHWEGLSEPLDDPVSILSPDERDRSGRECDDLPIQELAANGAQVCAGSTASKECQFPAPTEGRSATETSPIESAARVAGVA